MRLQTNRMSYMACKSLTFLCMGSSLALFVPGTTRFSYLPSRTSRVQHPGLHRSNLGTRYRYLAGVHDDMQESMKPVLEVEQKFQILNRNNNDDNDNTIEERLRNLSFVPTRTTKFVDWYFDTNDIVLSTRDCWLRFRGPVEADNESITCGIWQLKQGCNGDGTSKTTVYQETEGREAISIALSLLTKFYENNENSTPQKQFLPSEEIYKGLEVPKISADEEDFESVGGLLCPFSRIVTTRSSWKYDGNPDNNESFESNVDNLQPLPFHGLEVDLDLTDSGYAVGEVEALVEKESDVARAKERIQQLIDQLTMPPASSRANGDNRPALGKLEHFLLHQRPEHYKACIESGSVRPQ